MNDNRVEPKPAASTPAVSEHSSVLAGGTNVTGNIDCDGDILIDGTLRGAVRTSRLTVGTDGVIEGEISADEVTVRGSVKGPIHARHIHLESGAVVEGDLTTATIAIDTGARLTGAVWQEQQTAQPERYAPVTASTWESAAESASRSLLAVRPRITGSTR